MHCPFCQQIDTKVIDSRLVAEGQQVRRRRECLECQARFTTYESIEWSLPRLQKKDGSYVQFKEEKLRAGVLKALEKRPVNSGSVDKLIHAVVHQLKTSGENELSTQQIGDWVMAELKLLDKVAYVRFASVYRNFEDVTAFSEEIAALEDKEA